MVSQERILGCTEKAKRAVGLLKKDQYTLKKESGQAQRRAAGLKTKDA